MNKNFYFSIFLIFVTAFGAIAQINLDSSTSFQYLKGKDASAIPANWMTGDYIPSGWSAGMMPFRYGPVGTGGTLLSDMQNTYSTVYLRSTFNAQNIASLEDVVFSVGFDDGFVVWINGVEVFSINAPDDKVYNSFATGLGDPSVTKTYQLPAHDIALKEGENLIAIQGFNTPLASPDFYFNLTMNAVLPLPQTTDTVKVAFSKPNGFYTSPFDLKLDVPDPSYTFVYTIDGSNPQTSSTALDGGLSKTITIDPTSKTGRALTPCYIVRASLKKPGLAPSFPLTQTYIFLDQVMNQTSPGGNWPASGSHINGQTIDLDMDTDITKSSTYSGQMLSAMTDIPTISVVTELSDLFDAGTGIYVNALDHGQSWERFSSVELINPSGTPGFNINAGLRIRGGWSRHGNFPKHAFRLFFRQEYGAPKLTFPLFGNQGVNEFDKIDLRCEQNYSWAHPGDDKARNTAVREVFSRDTQRDMGRPYTRSLYYHLYLNGMYWGLYQTEERAEARYAASYFGGNKEDYDVIKVAVETQNAFVEATDGNVDSWQKIYNMGSKGFVNNADYFALDGKNQYGYPKKGGEVMVDIDNLIDFMQLIFYTGNFDSPVSAFMQNQGPNNFYAIDKRDDRSGGFIFFAHDAEHTMMIGPEGPGIGIQENRVTIPYMSVANFSKFHPQWLHYKLSANKEYRQRFADRAYKNFFNKGVFTPTALHDRFAKRAAEINKAIIGESARWGDAQRPLQPYTIVDWTNEINDIYTRYFPSRTDIVINQLKAASLYPNMDAPVLRKDNVILDLDRYTVSGNYQVTVSSTTGQIYVTLDGTDPRLIGDQMNPSATLIASGGAINLSGTSIVNARVKNGDNWSALALVKFMNPNEDYTNLKVTELHYHPKDSLIGTAIISGKSFEFIELKNTGDKPISLAGLNFSSSVKYQFKETDVLAPKQFYVIVSKPKWFYERHFMVPSGNFSGNFSNSGEQVTISNSAGSPIINFTYLDYNPWATTPDGDGSSLSSVHRNPTGNPADAAYWAASTVYDGTPFADDLGILDTIFDRQVADNQVAVYPNPTRGKLTLKVNKANSSIKVAIYTLSGSAIYNSSVVGSSVIDLSKLNIYPGIYLVKTKCEEKNLIHKVIYQP